MKTFKITFMVIARASRPNRQRAFEPSTHLAFSWHTPNPSSLTLWNARVTVSQSCSCLAEYPCTTRTGPIRIWRWSTGFGFSSTRSRPFELNFWYVFLKAKIMLGLGGNPLFGRFSCWLIWISEGAVAWSEEKKSKTNATLNCRRQVPPLLFWLFLRAGCCCSQNAPFFFVFHGP